MTRFPRVFTAVLVCVIACASHWPAIGALGPAVPTEAPSLAATPGNALVKLLWSPVAGAAGYRVFRSANGKWDPDPLVSTRTTSYTNTSLENGVTYAFTVAAYNTAGDGPLSLAVAATPLAPPADVTATPGDQRAKLVWTPSAGASSYTVYRRLSTDADFSEIATGVVSPPFVDMGLINGKRYYYQLRAVAGDAQSEPSARISAVAGLTSQ